MLAGKTIALPCLTTRNAIRICLLTCTLTPATYAAEYIEQDGPASSRIGDVQEAIGYAFKHPQEQRWYLMDDLKNALSDSPPFLRDTKFSFDFRSYMFDRHNTIIEDGSATAVGGQFRYESGEWNNLSTKLAWYNSSKISANGTATGLLTSENSNINILGEASLKYQFDTTALKGADLTLYRQQLNLPYLNKEDSRMLPSTHEGYVLQQGSKGLDYVLGHITKFKSRDSDEFVYMSEAAGVQDSNEGVTVTGIQLPIDDRLTLGAINIYGWDTFNTFYSETSYTDAILNGVDFRFSGQYTHQHSVGDEALSSFQTWHAALQAQFGWRGAILRLAGSRTADGAGIRSPWGGKPGYLSIQRSGFDAANERAVLLGLSYNTDYFSSLGLSSFINIAYGEKGRLPSQGIELPSRTEYNITVDYKPPGGTLKGLWLRLRWAHLDINGNSDNVSDVRIVVNYQLPLL